VIDNYASGFLRNDPARSFGLIVSLSAHPVEVPYSEECFLVLVPFFRGRRIDFRCVIKNIR
jgi:hypothetical protein